LFVSRLLLLPYLSSYLSIALCHCYRRYSRSPRGNNFGPFQLDFSFPPFLPLLVRCHRFQHAASQSFGLCRHFISPSLHSIPPNVGSSNSHRPFLFLFPQLSRSSSSSPSTSATSAIRAADGALQGHRRLTSTRSCPLKSPWSSSPPFASSSLFPPFLHSERRR
jgi:hypothetical protein